MFYIFTLAYLLTSVSANKMCYQELFPKLMGSGFQYNTVNSAIAIYTDLIA